MFCAVVVRLYPAWLERIAGQCRRTCFIGIFGGSQIPIERPRCTDDSAIGWTRRQANAQPSRNLLLLHHGRNPGLHNALETLLLLLLLKLLLRGRRLDFLFDLLDDTLVEIR